MDIENERENLIYFKELSHVIVGTGKPKSVGHGNTLEIQRTDVAA